MPIFYFDVKCVGDGKVVPITRYNDASSVPDTDALALKLVEMGPENGTLWVLIGSGRITAKNSDEVV